jgi:hypothetical protein
MSGYVTIFSNSKQLFWRRKPPIVPTMSIDRQSVCTRLDALYALRDDTFGVEQTKKDAQIASAIKEIHTMLDDMASSVQSKSMVSNQVF